MNKAVFIDKDGTLIPDIPYNTDPSLIELEENAIEGLRELKIQGFLLVIVSNQAGVAKGYFEEDALGAVELKIKALLAEKGIRLDGFYYCPHHPEGNVKTYTVDCNCRKPKPGMIERAARELNIDLSKSWMMGVILNDVEAGNRAGCKTVLIENGNETEWIKGEFRTPDFTVKSINEAAEQILKPIKTSLNHEYGIS